MREAAKCLAPSRTGAIVRLEHYKEEERVSLRETSAAVHARFMAFPSLFPPRADVTSIAKFTASHICIVPCSIWGCRSTVLVSRTRPTRMTWTPPRSSASTVWVITCRVPASWLSQGLDCYYYYYYYYYHYHYYYYYYYYYCA